LVSVPRVMGRILGRSAADERAGSVMADPGFAYGP
jgi:hypothetical protein